MVTARGRYTHEWFRHETSNQVILTSNLRTDLSVSSKHIIELSIQLQLSRRVFVIALDNIEAHLLRILYNLHEGRAKFFELVDMIAIGFGHTAVWLAILTAL